MDDKPTCYMCGKDAVCYAPISNEDGRSAIAWCVEHRPDGRKIATTFADVTILEIAKRTR